ncbi:Heparinase II/III-like protein [Filimonas lacunae]|uniref:Heparinase II/III-like protein n=1 Tax=Filimonas lacunae TaxID=477680 RepID=A0A173MLE1_9BACT|nr:heparinase II/III family protein [Filimonas lacunae]BAV08307.1 hypothetical protein FLA_4343 [Filimonas lacunae]SIT33315.1 Heparinase II/III-like protein [Filimonas lacunae]
MKTNVRALCMLLLIAAVAATAWQIVTPSYPQRNYLTNALQGKPVTSYISNIAAWRATQKQTLEQKIAVLPDSVKKTLLKQADAGMAFDWPTLSDSLYLEYKITGNRNHFEDKYNSRRSVLSNLVIGELLTHNGKYMPQIVKGLQVLMEEKTWVAPAHIGMQKAGVGLPDTHEVVIDLYSAITAATVAATQWMLYDQLDAASAGMNKRIAAELDTRIMQPYLQRSDFFWMGLQGQVVNNWNAWINTNVLYTVLCTQQSQVLDDIVPKILKSTDCFINQYPEDGGCDEGPGYWSVAGGKLIRLLALLQSASNGKCNFANKPLLQRMGDYIYKLHIADNYFVNFADAQPVTYPGAESVYYYGSMFGNDTMTHFAAYLFRQNKQRLGNGSLVDFLQQVAMYDKLATTTPGEGLPAVSWLPNLQVLSVRSKGGSTEGLFMAAKGGNNGESHNHNDIGNFVLYVNGRPVIVDAGVGGYTRKTFSKDRYSIWTMQSQWHNCPTINGVMQQDGSKFKATEVSCKHTAQQTRLDMDIAGAYPPEAMVKSWKRSLVFDAAKEQVQVNDNYLLSEYKEATRIHFLTCDQVNEAEPGQLTFTNTKGKVQLLLKYDAGNYTASIEPRPIDDDKMKPTWGNSLYRVSFITKSHQLQGSAGFVFSLPVR